MPEQGSADVEHDITVDAPAAIVYKVIADVANWPQVFPPTIYAERIEGTPAEERIRIWATANGEPKHWTSRRTLDRDRLRIAFRQEVSAPPVAAMGGEWLVEAVGQQQCRVRLRHDYKAVDDAPAKLAWIAQAVDRNSRAELAALKQSAERAAGPTGDTLLSFEDELHIEGRADDVYSFLNEAGQWSRRLPHVSRVLLSEDTPGLQVLEMDTKTRDGAVHTTKSVRVCFPHTKIVYKQTVLPALMTMHTGQWCLAENGDGVVATSRHTVAINVANVALVLGQEASLADAMSFVRNALSTNSLTTLRHAKEYAESRQ